MDLCSDPGNTCPLSHWAPDSLRFVCSTGIKDEDYLVNLNTRQKIQITTARTMTWIDNDRYLYMTIDYENENNELFLASVDGTQTRIDQRISEPNDFFTYYLSEDPTWSLQFDFSY